MAPTATFCGAKSVALGLALKIRDEGLAQVSGLILLSPFFIQTK